MPCTVVAADELPDFALPLNEEMRRHLETANALEVRVCTPIQLVGEQLLDVLGAILARWQADGMKHDQINLGLRWAGAKVGRCTFFYGLAPAVLPMIEVHAVRL